MHEVADEVLGTLRATGWESDTHGVTASGSLAAQSAAEWQRTIERWLDPPRRRQRGDGALDRARQPRRAGPGRRLRRAGAARGPAGAARACCARCSGWRSPTSRPPASSRTSWSRAPVSIAGTSTSSGAGWSRSSTSPATPRLAAGATVTSTIERLRAAADAGTLPRGDARTLEEAYDLFAALRLEHQVHQLEAGRTPDDHLDPKALNALTRQLPQGCVPGRRIGAEAPGRRADLERLMPYPRPARPGGRRLLRGRPGDDRPRPGERRDHLVGRPADRRRTAAGGRPSPPARPPAPDARRGDDRDPRPEGDRPGRCPRPGRDPRRAAGCGLGHGPDRACRLRGARASSTPRSPIATWSSPTRSSTRRGWRGARCAAAAGGSRRRSAWSRWRTSSALPAHRPHTADGDALTTAQVFLALATHLDALEPQTVGSLQRPSAASRRSGAVSRLGA